MHCFPNRTRVACVLVGHLRSAPPALGTRSQCPPLTAERSLPRAAPYTPSEGVHVGGVMETGDARAATLPDSTEGEAGRSEAHANVGPVGLK
eukprot:1549005-Pleurochrysis_carterae.AAC.4